MIKLPLISKEKAIEVSDTIIGIPSENRVLIVTIPDEEIVTNSGIIVPTNAREELPKKGVIVKAGIITEDYKSYSSYIKIGNIVTFGNYAGKKILPKTTNNNKEIEDYNYSVLSLTEILFIEPNN